MSIGARWACCATNDGLRCARRPPDASGVRGPISEQAFAERKTVRFAGISHVRDVVVSGDAACLRDANDVVRCHPNLRRPGLPWSPLPGAFLALEGGQTSGDAPPALCGILPDESIACFRFAAHASGTALEPIGTVAGRFRGVRVGATAACGVNEHEDTVCWPLPPASSRAPLPTTRRLDANDGLVVALDLWDDAGCAVLKGSGVVCWEGASPARKLRVSVASAMPEALKLGGRIACITFQAGRDVRCWKRGATIWDGERLPDRYTGTSHAFVGAQEACTPGWLENRLECWNEANAPIAHVPEATRPPDPPSPPPPPPPAPRPPHLETEWAFHGGIPFSYGAGWYRTRTGTSSGSWLRFRAVAAWGPGRTRLVDDHGASVGGGPAYGHGWWAVGPYAEVAWHRVAPARQISFGAGAIGIFWFSKLWALTPTVGWYQQDHAGAPKEHGLAVSVGLDNASREWDALMVPLGLRIEARYGLGGAGERSFLASGEADALIAIAAPVAMYLLATATWRF